MVNLAFLHMWEWELMRAGGAVVGTLLAYPLGHRLRRAVIRRWAVR